MMDENVKSQISQKQYLRIGEIPPDGKSKIYHHIDNSIIGEELGISVFEYIEGRGIVVPHNKKAHDDFLTLVRSWWKPQYIVHGEEIGTGEDGEPLLKDVKIIKTLKRADTEIGYKLSNPKTCTEELSIDLCQKRKTTPPICDAAMLEQYAKDMNKIEAKIKVLEEVLAEFNKHISFKPDTEAARNKNYNTFTVNEIDILKKLIDNELKYAHSDDETRYVLLQLALKCRDILKDSQKTLK